MCMAGQHIQLATTVMSGRNPFISRAVQIICAVNSVSPMPEPQNEQGLDDCIDIMILNLIFEAEIFQPPPHIFKITL